MQESGARVYEFEGFRLNVDSPGLWRGGELVQMPPKELEILILLVTSGGEIVSRETLLESVWKDTFVEEGNINYTISLLRKSLGNKNLIQTIPRRGYRFTADVCVASTAPVAADLAQAARNAPRRWMFATLALLCVVTLTSFAVWYGGNSKSVPIGERSIRSVAILPFKTLDADERDERIVLGLTDSLISRLGSLNRFAVRPFEAVSKPRMDGEDAIAFGSRSRVDAVLDGTFERIDDRLRVTARLVDVRDGVQLWTGKFDESEADLFALQDKLADAIARSLTKELSDRDIRRIAKHQTVSPEAYQAYIRGRTIFDQRDPRTFSRALDEFQQAVTLDPTFALAYTGLADGHSRIGSLTIGKEADAAYAKARSYAQKALSLDADLAEGYTSLRRIKRMYDWDWSGSEQDFRRAIEINPNLAEAHFYYSQTLSNLLRHDEALAEIETALRIDPISPSIQISQFAILEAAGRFDEGLALAESMAVTNRDNVTVQRSLATFLLHKGENQRVIELSNDMLASGARQKFAWLSLVSTAYARTGRIAEANDALAHLEADSKSDTKALYSIAANYAELGLYDDAIAALRSCYQQREERMAWLNTEPRFGALHNDPRFRELAKRIGLE